MMLRSLGREEGGKKETSFKEGWEEGRVGGWKGGRNEGREGDRKERGKEGRTPQSCMWRNMHRGNTARAGRSW